jgi:hypothetical protein
MKRGSREYHGIVIKESLREQSILDKIQVLGIKRTGSWTLLRVRIRETELGKFVGLIRRNLLTDVHYYAHFYREGELIVVFPKRTFRLKPDKSTWEPVVSYGTSIGIPEGELDFKPCRFEDETY